LYFQVGIGVGHGSFPTATVTPTPSRIDVTRPAVLVGVGYDIPALCPLWIAPNVQVFNTLGGRRLQNGTASANAVLYQVGVALKYFHPGPSGACTRRSPI